ncbi:site-specific integrase [Microbispora sp. H13382]|uniref:site-specific integrase n=1 Tax=Microbispora sp. H13382 TaxID=2729112 RepID=UPI001C72536B|nr:site-specific integrase [Microbispora sp. H13382]
MAQAGEVLEAAEGRSLYAYVVVSLLTGARTEELRALTWDHVDLEGLPDATPPVPPYVAVWRSVRAGGDTKTRKSRRTLALPQRCVDVLRQHRDEHELRRSFVSLLSDSGVPLEEISRLVGHSSTAVTELVYRKQIRPVLQGGAVVMDQIFNT